MIPTDKLKADFAKYGCGMQTDLLYQTTANLHYVMENANS